MFTNEALTNFTAADSRKRFSAALEQVAARIDREDFVACSIVKGEEIKRGADNRRPDPSDSSIIFGRSLLAGPDLAESAIDELRSGAQKWGDVPAEERAHIIARAGGIIRERRLFLAALMVREAGKPWKEADADVAEAIDFCEYYALEMRRLCKPQLTMQIPGEENYYLYQPRGVTSVISPWNFPLAIACGMTVASLVCGNATLLKPAEPTCQIAFEFAKILLEAGVPPYAFALLIGRGSVIGDIITSSPKVDTICFTGSKEVGLQIIQTAAIVHPGQSRIKRVVAELGGKNAIIIDDDADLDEAIKGVSYSAFGFAGQKCSACSRLIVVGDAYELFLNRLAEATSGMSIGAAREPQTIIGPVIDERSENRITAVIDTAAQSEKLFYRGSAPRGGYYVAPAIFADVAQDSALWQEEIFGPVLACARARTFDEALAMAGNSQYALTGGVYSRLPSNLEKAKRQFKVGNLYLNRGITGALVCRQPFGGSKMSGIGSKAGGPDYLQQFLEPRTITENTMRRGFAG